MQGGIDWVDGMLCEPTAVGGDWRDSIVGLMDLCGSELAGGLGCW